MHRRNAVAPPRLSPLVIFADVSQLLGDVAALISGFSQSTHGTQGFESFGTVRSVNRSYRTKGRCRFDSVLNPFDHCWHRRCVSVRCDDPVLRPILDHFGRGRIQSFRLITSGSGCRPGKYKIGYKDEAGMSHGMKTHAYFILSWITTIAILDAMESRSLA